MVGVALTPNQCGDTTTATAPGNARGCFVCDAPGRRISDP
jgi:hypothetical protein